MSLISILKKNIEILMNILQGISNQVQELIASSYISVIVN